MTPQERAEKIIGYQAANHLSWNKMIDYLTAQIEEAERDAKEQGFRQGYELAYQRAKDDFNIHD